MSEKRYIRHSISTSIGSSESTEMYILIDTKTGQSEVVIKKTITERMPVTQIENAKATYRDITEGGPAGRQIITLDDFK